MSREWNKDGLVKANDRPKRKMQGSKMVERDTYNTKKKSQLRKPGKNRKKRFLTKNQRTFPGRQQAKRTGKVAPHDY